MINPRSDISSTYNNLYSLRRILDIIELALIIILIRSFVEVLITHKIDGYHETIFDYFFSLPIIILVYIKLYCVSLVTIHDVYTYNAIFTEQVTFVKTRRVRTCLIIIEIRNNFVLLRTPRSRPYEMYQMKSKFVTT